MKNFGTLKGIKILDLSRLLPGPFCSMILADHGARVITIEDKKYKADGHYIPALYRNKEHMTLNLKTKEGKKIFDELVHDADIVIEGFRPGVVKKLGLDYKSISKINPKIIYCSITGFGQTGCYKDIAGHDINFLGFSGVLDLIGEKDQPPSIPGVQLADIAGGGMNAAIGILLALFNREKSGEGQYIDISMSDGMVSFLPVVLFFSEIMGQIPQRSDFFLSHRYACYNTYETADKKYIAVGAVEHRFWEKLCKHIKASQYIPLQYDENKRLEIIEFMRTTFKQKTLKEWEKELSNLDICVSKVQNVNEVLNDPHFIEREMIPQKNTNKEKVTEYYDTPGNFSSFTYG